MAKTLQDERNPSLNSSIASFARNPAVLFGIVLLITTTVKLFSLNSRELWLDETYSAFVANLSFANILRFSQGDVHPPLFYLLLRVWVLVIGDAQAQLRLFSVVVNFFSSVAMYVFAKRMLGGRLGAFAAALFAFSSTVFIYSLEVRMYMLMTFLVICLLIVHWLVAIEKHEGRWPVLVYAVLAALLFYVHYIDVFIVAAFFVHWLIVSRFHRRSILSLLAAALLTIVLVSPGVPTLLHQYAGKSELTRVLEVSRHNPDALSFVANVKAIEEPTGIRALQRSLASMTRFNPAESPLAFLLRMIPLLLALATIGFLAIRESDEICRLFFLLAVAVLVGMMVLHLTAVRYMTPLIPPLALAIARALQYWAAKPRWRVLGLSLGALILCIYAAGFFRQATKQRARPWQNLVSAVQQNYRPGDTVVFDALYAQVPFDYFASRTSFHPTEEGFPVSVYDWWNSQSFKGWGSPVMMKSDLDQYVSNLANSKPKTVWLVQFETRTYDTHYALLDRLSRLGQATEFPLPADLEDTKLNGRPPLRLIRISIN